MNRIIYQAERERDEPERWRAWTEQVPAVTGYGKTPGEAVDNVAESEVVLEYQWGGEVTTDPEPGEVTP